MVGMVANGNEHPIDAVVLWVDGADPAHAAKLHGFLQARGLAPTGVASKTRFHNAGELDYCVASLLKFAPWLNKIFIVTDAQRPPLMDKLVGTEYEQKVCLIDHTTVFAGHEECLPSFNSMAISSLLWKIPGLAERFIYLNDDFVLIRPVSPQDFFCNENVVLRGRWHMLPEMIPGHGLWESVKQRFYARGGKNSVSFWRLQQITARVFGFTERYFRLPHVPHAWKRSSWERIFAEYPELMAINIQAQLRRPDQYIPEGMSAHFHWRERLVTLADGSANVQLKPSNQALWRIRWKLAAAEKNNKIIFACLQSVERGSRAKQELIFTWLNKRIGSLDDLLASRPGQ